MRMQGVGEDGEEAPALFVALTEPSSITGQRRLIQPCSSNTAALHV